MLGFEEAAKRHEEHKSREERKKGGFSYDDFEVVKRMPLNYGEDDKYNEKVFRILGMPLEFREKPSDCKLIYHSRIVRDNGQGYAHIVWKTVLNDLGIPELDKDWILTRLYEKVMQSDWVNWSEEEKEAHKDDRNPRGRYIPRFTNTKTYARVSTNKKENEKFPPNFFPSKRVLMNIINRMDSWCKDNKHSEILFVNVSPWTTTDADGKQKTIDFVNDYGIPKMAYDLIYDNVLKYHPEGWLDIDIIMRATGKLQGSYEVKDITERKITELSRKVGKEGPLTKEELAYEVYDLDKLFGHSSYNKLHKNFIGLFKTFDADFSESFVKELEHLVDEEKKVAEQKKKEKEELEKEQKGEGSPAPVIKEEKKEDIKKEEPVKEKKEEIKVEQSKTETPARSQRPAPQSEQKKDDLSVAFPNWDKLDQMDKEDVNGALDHFEGTIPIWKEGINLYPCDNGCTYIGTSEKTHLPSTVMYCPVCGTHFATNSEV